MQMSKQRVRVKNKRQDKTRQYHFIFQLHFIHKDKIIFSFAFSFLYKPPSL